MKKAAAENFAGKSKAANYFADNRALSGTLYFDETALLFVPRNTEAQKNNVCILYNEIKAIETFRTLGFIANGMMLLTKKGKQHRFAVNNRKAVIAFLNNKRQV